MTNGPKEISQKQKAKNFYLTVSSTPFARVRSMCHQGMGLGCRERPRGLGGSASGMRVNRRKSPLSSRSAGSAALCLHSPGPRFLLRYLRSLVPLFVPHHPSSWVGGGKSVSLHVPTLVGWYELPVTCVEKDAEATPWPWEEELSWPAACWKHRIAGECRVHAAWTSRVG